MTTPSTGDLQLLWSIRDYSTNVVSRAVVNLLADGRRSTGEALAAATGMTGDDVRTFIERASLRRRGRRWGCCRARADLAPDPALVPGTGNDLYTWCGFEVANIGHLPSLSTMVSGGGHGVTTVRFRADRR
jgi:hypothetical protein